MTTTTNTVPPADATCHHCGSCPALVDVERIREMDGGDWVRRRCTRYHVDDMPSFFATLTARLPVYLEAARKGE